MGYGNCECCGNEITLEEFNFALFTNTGNGGLCGPCVKAKLEALAEKDRKVDRLTAEVAFLRDNIAALTADLAQTKQERDDAIDCNIQNIAKANRRSDQMSAKLSALAAERDRLKEQLDRQCLYIKTLRVGTKNDRAENEQLQERVGKLEDVLHSMAQCGCRSMGCTEEQCDWYDEALAPHPPAEGKEITETGNTFPSADERNL